MRRRSGRRRRSDNKRRNLRRRSATTPGRRGALPVLVRWSDSVFTLFLPACSATPPGPPMTSAACRYPRRAAGARDGRLQQGDEDQPPPLRVPARRAAAARRPQRPQRLRLVRRRNCGSLANSSSSKAGTEIRAHAPGCPAPGACQAPVAASSTIRSTRHVKALRTSDGVTSGRCNAASVGASSSVDGIAAQRERRCTASRWSASARGSRPRAHPGGRSPARCRRSPRSRRPGVVVGAALQQRAQRCRRRHPRKQLLVVRNAMMDPSAITPALAHALMAQIAAGAPGAAELQRRYGAAIMHVLGQSQPQQPPPASAPPQPADPAAGRGGSSPRATPSASPRQSSPPTRHPEFPGCQPRPTSPRPPRWRRRRRRASTT